MFKKIIYVHRVFIGLILTIILLAYIANLFINKNTIIIGGEYIFSFDHFGHVQNILNDPRSSLAQDNTNCFDCPDFYHYSRWYSLFKIGFHSLSQILHLHPFIFLILSMVLTQLVSLYVFTRTIFSKFKLIPFLIATYIFIFYPYKYSLLIETHDGLLYSNMILYITALVWGMQHILKLSNRRLILISVASGILLSFFLNVNVAFLPIIIYTTIIISIVFRKHLLANIKRAFVYFLAMFIPAILINVPLLQSLIINGNSRHYEGYISFNYIDSFLSGLSIAATDPQIIASFAILFIGCFIYAPIKRKYKLWMGLVYLLIGVMINGMNSPINIYGWMFESIPLMDSLRSTYRFMFFELMIIFIVIYYSLRRLNQGNFFQLIVFGIVSGVYIYLPLQHIYTHREYFFKEALPMEYFNVQQYINTKVDKKVYFPPRTPLFHSIATDYTWGDPDYKASILLYKNPYTSLLPVRNLVQFERFPYLLSPEYLELHYLTDLSLPPKDIIRALELRGITYIILDKNYKWNERYPQFDLDSFVKQTKVEKKWGNLLVLRLVDRSTECKKGYGDISVEYCTSADSDTKLINKTKEEFALETFPEKIGQKMSVRKNSVYTKSVLDPILHQALVDHRVLFGKEIMQVSGNQKSLFNSSQLPVGMYRVYISLFKYSSEGTLMKNASLVVRTSEKESRRISPYNSKPGIYWERVDIKVEEGKSISIDIDKDGYIIITAIPIIKKL